MRVLNVPGIHCEKCGERIEKALQQSKIKNFEVNVTNKTVSVCDCDKCETIARKILDDLGFEVKGA